MLTRHFCALKRLFWLHPVALGALTQLWAGASVEGAGFDGQVRHNGFSQHLLGFTVLIVNSYSISFLGLVLENPLNPQKVKSSAKSSGHGWKNKSICSSRVKP